MAGETLAAIFGALEHRPHDWRVVFDRSHPVEGPAADAARESRRRIAEQAASGVRAVLPNQGLSDPDDLSAFTAVWMGTVTALVDWWLAHPEESAEAMTARSKRLFNLFG